MPDEDEKQAAHDRRRDEGMRWLLTHPPQLQKDSTLKAIRAKEKATDAALMHGQ